MKLASRNHWLRKTFLMLALAGLLLGGSGQAVFAQDAAHDNAVNALKARQEEVNQLLKNLEMQVDNMSSTNPKKDEMEKALEDAKTAFDDFKALDPAQSVTSENQPTQEFAAAEENAVSAINKVSQLFVSPNRPESVPQGDILKDFIPQVVRQLFRFAYLAILIALTVAGVMMVVSYDSEERVTKAKNIIIYSLIGFAFITLAFAIVKAITNINLF